MTFKDLNQEKDEESLNKYTEEMELNEKHLSLFFDTLSDAIFLLAVEPDDCFRFMSVNRAFLALIGLNREQVVSKRIEQVLPETAHALVIGKYKEAISENKTVFWEQASTYPTGERVVAVAVMPVWNAEGVCTHLVGSMYDLTERKKAEEALRESEKRIRDLMECIPIGILVSNPKGDVPEVNKALLKIFGYDSKEEFVNTPAEAHYYNSKDRERFVKLNKKGLVKGFELQFKHKDGSAFWGSITLAMVTTRDGNTEFINAFQEITKHKQVDEALPKSEERMRTMFEEAPLGIALIDSLTAHIYEVNPQFAEIAGRSREEMATIDWISITHPDDVQEDLDNMALLNTGKITGFNMNKRYIRPDGSLVWINMTIAPIKVEDETQTRHLCMIENITKRKQSEAELQKLNNELELRVEDHTAELEVKNEDLEHMNRVFVGRELRMAELNGIIKDFEEKIASVGNKGE